MTRLCLNLDEVRHEIDRLDRQLLILIAERGRYVAQATAFKASAAAVAAPQRVEQIIARITALARELGADPAVVEATWRAMIAAFIASELQTHAQRAAATAPPPAP